MSPRALLAAILACTVMLGADGARPAVGQDRDANDTALRSYYSANGFLNRGLYDLAAAEYRKFLEEHPDHEHAMIAEYGLGVSLFRLDRHAEAAVRLQALAQDRSFTYAAEAGTILGQCHLALGANAEAAAALEAVLEAHPDHDLADDAASLLAEALYQSGAYERVDPVCRSATERWPQSPRRERVELLRGLALMARGDYAAAAPIFRESGERFPQGAAADHRALLLAQCLHRAKKLEDASDAYRAVLRRGVEAYVPDALYGLAALLQQQRNPAAAGELLDDLTKRFPRDELVPAARLLRGRVDFDLGRFDQALRRFEALARTGGPYQDDAQYWMAKCELRRDEPAAAAARLGRAVERFPKSELQPEMVYDRAVALVRSGDPEAALAQLELFRKRHAKHALAPEALHLTAATQHQLSRFEESAESCREFRRRYPGHNLSIAIAFLAAENAFLRQDYERAVIAYGAFLEEHPGAPQTDDARFRLGTALYRIDDYDRAEPILSDLVRGRRTPEGYRTALLALGDLRFQRGDWTEAEALLTDYLSFGLEQPSADDALLKLALALHRQREHEAALERFSELLTRFPESPHRRQAIFERGQALVALDRDAEAETAFLAVIEDGAADGDGSRLAVFARNHLGAIALEAGRYDEAAIHFGHVAGGEETGLVAEALFQRGQALAAAGRHDEAVDAFAALIEDHPESSRAAQARARRALALARQQKREAALRAIEEVETAHADGLDPDLIATLTYEKAWCLRGLDRPDEAAVAYRRLLRGKHGPDLQRHARLELAELETNAGRHEEAATLLAVLLEDLDRAPERAPDLHEQALYRLGVCAFTRKQYREAAAWLERFCDTYPESSVFASAGLLGGEALLETGAHPRAAARLTAVVDADPDPETLGPALLRLGECLAVLQQWPRSEAAFNAYLERFSASDLWFQAQFGLAWARENQGRFREAIDTYRPVADRHRGPTAARAQFQIGECLFAEKELEEAVRELLKVDILYTYPEWSAAALYEAGRCFEEMGDPVSARTHFEQVTRDHGKTSWAQLAVKRLAQMKKTTLPGR